MVTMDVGQPVQVLPPLCLSLSLPQGYPMNGQPPRSVSGWGGGQWASVMVGCLPGCAGWWGGLAVHM